ncbi:hypothetical protein [Streptomyces sp. MK7]|uniref:hypothetical protein n=1 Tax=Streptomyces sp. MK7 TaxID=3067635 RepID=UPI002930ACAD|nr:hypothetical protein [Streptomyces sp. MK7]
MARDGFCHLRGRPRRIVTIIRECRRAVQALLAEGRPLRDISSDLDLDSYTVRAVTRGP